LEKSEKLNAQNFLDSKAQHLIEIIEDSAFASLLKFSFQSLIDDLGNSGKANVMNHGSGCIMTASCCASAYA
jgi:hypothetical protein